MKHLIKQFNLPDYIKNAKSFSEASKMIMNKFEEKEDPVSKNTMKELMSRLRDAQEFIKSQSEDNTNQNINPILNNDESNQFFLGGLSSAIGGAGAGAGGALGAAGKAGGLGEVLGSVGGMTQGAMQNANTQSTDPVSSGLSGALSGAASGAALGPAGAIVGGLVGGVSSVFRANAAKKAQLRKEKEETQMNSNKILNTYKMGGKINKYQTVGLFDYLKPRGVENVGTGIDNNVIGFTPTLDVQSREVENVEPNFDTNLASTSPTLLKEPSFLNKLGNKTGRTAKGIGEFAKNNKEALRYAPVAMNALQAINLEKPDAVSLNRLDNTYSPQYTDEQALQNIIREQFNTTNEALAGASDGSTSALRSNILASGLNRAKAMSDGYGNSVERNAGENKAAQQFKLGVDNINLGQANLEEDINANNIGAYETQKSNTLSRLGQNLDSIGKEEAQKNIIEKLTGYDQQGKYVVDPVSKKKIYSNENGFTKALKNLEQFKSPSLSNTPFNPIDSLKLG